MTDFNKACKSVQSMSEDDMSICAKGSEMSHPPRLSAIILSKSIADKFSVAEDMGEAMGDIITAAHLITEFLEGSTLGEVVDFDNDDGDEAHH